MEVNEKGWLEAEGALGLGIHTGRFLPIGEFVVCSSWMFFTFRWEVLGK